MPSITLHCATLRILHSKLILAALMALIFAVTTYSALADSNQLRFRFQDIININDPTFNQELGINNFGVIAGYFGSGAQGHPNKGYTVVPPYTNQLNFTNENFPGSVQTQVTGINNRGRFLFGHVFSGTTVGFWSDSNNANMLNNNFGFVNLVAKTVPL